MAYSADKKPGELTALTSLATDDVFVVGDTSDASEVAKYITKANLLTDLGATFEPLKGADDNFVTDAEKVKLSNLSGTNTGDQDLSTLAPKASPTFTGTVTLPVGLTGVIRADTGVVSVDTDVTDIVASGTDTTAGKLELATDAETVTGTDTARATTPANITAKMSAPGAIGNTTPSTGKFTTVETTGGIELGHASDTTLTRVSAGVVAVEGTNLVKAGAATSSGLTMATSRVLGRTTAATGAIEELSTVDSFVSASSTTTAGKVELATTAEINTGTDSTRAMPVDQYVASNRNVRYVVLRAIAPATDWSVNGTTNVWGDFPAPFTGTIVSVRGDVDTAGTTGTATVDVNLNGSTIMTTHKLNWDSTEKSTSTYSGTAATLTTTAVTAGDIITIDIDTNHTTKSKGLTVTLGIRMT